MIIRKIAAPGLGDIRQARGIIHVERAAMDRPDWSRIVGAIADAVSRGCSVNFM